MPSKESPSRASSVAPPETATAEVGPEVVQSMGNSAAQADFGIAATPPPGDGELHQSSPHLFKLYEAAATAMVTLGDQTSALASSTNGKPMIPSELKGFARARAKIDADYGGDASRIVDLARSSVFYDDVSDLMTGVEEVRGSWTVVREKDRFEAPVGGYRDIMFNVDIGGHICEIQLHLTKIIEAKAEGHGDYERVSELKRKMKEGGGLSDEEDAELVALKAAQWKLYNDAYASAGGEVTDDQRAKEGGA